MEIKIIRSRRRKKTVSMREVNGVIQLYLPLGVSRKEELEYMQWARKRIEAARKNRYPKTERARGYLMAVGMSD